jgi:membrane-bound metal-dependent hydrolase YbcI (DUF457 family)
LVVGELLPVSGGITVAAFHQHLLVSACTGVAYGATLAHAGYVNAPEAALAAAVCTFGGILPDLDSDSSKPVRELFHLLGSVAAIVTLHRFHRHVSVSTEIALLLAAAAYLFTRYVAAQFFAWLTVHRGMFHSLPAAILAGELIFLIYDSAELPARWTVAAAMSLGYLSHLLLDAVWDLRSVRNGMTSRLGGPLKLFGSSPVANVFCWTCLLAAAYLIAVEQNWLAPVEPFSPRVLRALEIPGHPRTTHLH